MRFLTAIAVAALLLAACGAGEGENDNAAPQPDRRPDRKAIAGVVLSYLDAYLSGRGAEACDRYTDSMHRELDQRARKMGFPGGCGEVLSKVGPSLSEDTTPAQRKELLERTRNGRVNLRFGGPDLALAAITQRGARRPSPKRVELKRERGEWRISRLGIRPEARWP